IYLLQVSLQSFPRFGGRCLHHGCRKDFWLIFRMWYGVFLWAVVSSLVFHLPAALLALATLRRHKMARFFPIGILLMGIIGPLFGGILTSIHIAAAPREQFGVWCLVGLGTETRYQYGTGTYVTGMY
uniref:Transmembrane protein 170A n=1 Tax=Sinocyclocheilus grahami TaxID=75366 RepID=A0A672M7C3_SINGR